MLRHIYNFFLPLLFLLVFLPLLTHAQVVINEVQLLPTTERFIELYNSGNSPVDLSDWFMQRKTATGSSFGSLVSKTYFQGKTIGSNSYFLISRIQFGNSDIALDSLTLTESNTLQIKKGEDVIDKVGWGSANDCGSPCPPNPTEGQSIQRIASEWVVGSPTPKASNTPIPSEVSNQNNGQTSSAGTSSTSSSNTSLASSAHYNSIPLSSKNSEAEVALGAGRNRLGSAGSPLEFRVETDLKYTRNTIFKWNFGDGSEGVGDVLTHTYEYPGEYVVVLNTSTSGEQATARANVRIIDPDLKISSVSPERIEIKNNSKYEISLFGRVLVSGKNFFAFPQDTIIKSGQSISFSSKITGLRPTGPHEADLLVVGNTENAKMLVKIEEQKAEKIAQIQSQIASLQQRIARVYVYPIPHLAVPPPSGDGAEQIAKELIENESNETKVLLSQTASPKNGWLLVLKKFFLRTE